MIYLSRLILNPRSRMVRRDLADCQQLHRTVLSAFPQAEAAGSGAREQFGILHRVDTIPSGSILLVQSGVEPAWDRLPSDYALAQPVSKRVDELYAGVTSGSRLHFRLRANPTKRLKTGTEQKGPRVDLRREADQLSWLGAKAEAGGFSLCRVQTNHDVASVQTTLGSRVIGHRAAPRVAPSERAKLTFGSVLFEGELQVTDPALFLDTLTHGIGSGKAYGFGLLSVAPAAS